MRVVAESVPDGVVMRMAVRGDRWGEGIPPLPDGFEVTVSFSSDEAADLHGAALRLLGYRVLPVAPAAATGAGGSGSPPAAEAHFLVPRSLARAHPTFYRALLDRAERAYDLAFGPAAALLSDVIAAHRASAERW